MRVARGILVGAAVGTLTLSGCTPIVEEVAVSQTQSTQSSSPQSSVAPEEALAAWEQAGIPFMLRAPADPWGSTSILHAADAITWEASVPRVESGEGGGEPLTITPIGQTMTGEGGLPGPSIRAILNSTQALAGLLTPELGVEITDLSQVPTKLGIVGEDGVFKETASLAAGPVELEGSNPEGLYFEPQDFSVNGDWVSWREGSAGRIGALPVLDFDDWRIVGWDQSAREPQEYASGYLLHGQRQAPRISWNGAPTVDGQYIYFAAALPDALVSGTGASSSEEQWVSSVIRVPLDSPGEVEVVGVGTAPAAAPDGGVYWVGGGTDLIFTPADQAEGERVLWEVETPGWEITSLTASGKYVFAVVTGVTSQAAWILAWEVSSGQVVAALESNTDWVELSASENLVTWGNGTANSDPSMYLWRLGDKSVVSLGGTQGFSVPKVGEGLLAIPRLSDSGAILWDLARVA